MNEILQVSCIILPILITLIVIYFGTRIRITIGKKVRQLKSSGEYGKWAKQNRILIIADYCFQFGFVVALFLIFIPTLMKISITLLFGILAFGVVTTVILYQRLKIEI